MVRRLMAAAVLAAFSITFAATAALADDFSKAEELIKSKGPALIYGQLCSEAPKGEDKAACRLARVPSVAFLICQEHDVGGSPCKAVISTEVGNLTTVARAKLRTVTFHTKILGPVRCYSEANADCYGYLASWVSTSEGKFINLQDEILAGNTNKVAERIRAYTKPVELKATAKNIQSIADFMKFDRRKYNQICDLQGFYLQGGGFLINDVPELVINAPTIPTCGGMPGPNYNDILDGLEAIVRLLK